MKSSHSDVTIPDNNDLRFSDKRFQLMQEIVEQKGLEGFKTYLSQAESKELGIGVDYFPTFNDIMKLSSYVKDAVHDFEPGNISNIFNKTPSKPYIQPAPAMLHDEVLESDGRGMKYISNSSFESWEGTVKKSPQIIFMPKTKKGLMNLVLWADKNKLRIRASGYRHSSSEMYADDDQILVSMLDVHTVTSLPAPHPDMDPNNEMQSIKLVGEAYEVDGKKKIKCKIGSATTNYHIQDWIHDENGGNSEWTLPLNVIMTEITFGGSNATICHGGGINNKTLSDLVTEIEFVNAKGELQCISDKNQLKAAAGCFGILGIVTSLTVELDAMTYANLKTVKKQLLSAAIPAPSHVSFENLENNLSEQNLEVMGNKQIKEQAFKKFADYCENNYYNEFFWFPLHDQVWINSWKNDGKKEDAVRYPDEFTDKLQQTSSYLFYLSTMIGNDKFMTTAMKRLQTELYAHVAMKVMPDQMDTVCTLHDALHFRKGIQNFKTRMMEIEIPIPDMKKTRSPDWSVCQKAWWAVVESTYSEKNMKLFPMRTSLEMRVMGGSNILMAAQYGNKRTCSIEVLSPLCVNENVWKQFIQEVLDKWATLKNDKGEYLMIRPHWAKHFDGLMINRDKSWINQWSHKQKIQLKKYLSQDSQMISMPMREYLTVIAYKDQIIQFKKQIDSICRQGGYQYIDIKNRFSNSFLDELMSDTLVPHHAHQYAKLFHAKPNSCHDFASRANQVVRSVISKASTCR